MMSCVRRGEPAANAVVARLHLLGKRKTGRPQFRSPPTADTHPRTHAGGDAGDPGVLRSGPPQCMERVAVASAQRERKVPAFRGNEAAGSGGQSPGESTGRPVCGPRTYSARKSRIKLYSTT